MIRTLRDGWKNEEGMGTYIVIMAFFASVAACVSMVMLPLIPLISGCLLDIKIVISFIKVFIKGCAEGEG